LKFGALLTPLITISSEIQNDYILFWWAWNWLRLELSIKVQIATPSVGKKKNSNPFQQSNPTFPLFLTALFRHAVTTMADFSLPSTMIIFHFTGLVTTLLWILLPQFWNWYIINLFLLLITSFCFFDCIYNIIKPYLPSPSNVGCRRPNKINK